MTKKKYLKFATIADPVESFNPIAETTFFLLAEINQRQHQSWICGISDLYLDCGDLKAKACQIHVTKEAGKFVYKQDEKQILDLNKLDCLLLRKDPPIDEVFIQHLILLGQLEKKAKGRILMMNSPTGILKANEKIYPLQFENMSPPTVVSCDQETLLDFLNEQERVVLKPLNASGGRGIQILDKNRVEDLCHLEKATDSFSKFVMLQKYLPQAKEGDKRILLFNGNPLGAFLRVPAPGDFRGNLHCGASWVKSKITSHEEKIIQKMKPCLVEDGLFFVGLDCIGGFITEVNVTSPMGIRELNELNHQKIEQFILDQLSHHLMPR